jgi:predicted Rossmann-fold nucleotide-binding protein
LIDHQIAEGYVRPHHRDLFQVVATPEAVFEVIAEARAPTEPSHPERI